MQDLYLDITASEGYPAVSAKTLCVSGIYHSEVKYKYSTVTLGGTV